MERRDFLKGLVVLPLAFSFYRAAFNDVAEVQYNVTGLVVENPETSIGILVRGFAEPIGGGQALSFSFTIAREDDSLIMLGLEGVQREFRERAYGKIKGVKRSHGSVGNGVYPSNWEILD